MSALIGASLPVVLIFTGLIMGWIAFMTGRALARTWRPMWQVFPYCALLGFADRFFVYALFDGELLAGFGLLLATAYLCVVGLASYREKLAFKMVSQYPWLYERSGPFGWRERKLAKS